MNTGGRRSELDTRAVTLVLACAALWGLGQVAAKLGLAEIPPLLQAALRSVGAALLLLGWCAWRRLPVFARDGTGPAGLVAGLLFAAEFACIFSGLQFTTASRMTVFLYVAPFVVALGMPLISRSERLQATQVGGLLLAFAGVVWAFAEGLTQPAAGDRQWLGDALGLAAACFWGVTTLTVRGTRLATASAEKTLLYQLVVSGAALGAASLLRGETVPAALSPLSWGVLGFQTVLITFASYLVWFWLVRHYPATKISSFTLLTPLFGLLAGVLLLNEPLTARLATALATVCLGIWLVNRPRPA
ncbi:MAG: DMT family transporter [Rubrivivax sp.]|nr:DMT family transporter [Rubrivivax sp.]